MIKAIEELQKTHNKMGAVLKELQTLEDGEGADYSDAVIDYKWILQDLQNRLQKLQKRSKI